MLSHLPDTVRDDLLGIQARAWPCGGRSRTQITDTFKGLRGLPDRLAGWLGLFQEQEEVPGEE